jgi:hypothetical protein
MPAAIVVRGFSTSPHVHGTRVAIRKENTLGQLDEKYIAMALHCTAVADDACAISKALVIIPRQHTRS